MTNEEIDAVIFEMMPTLTLSDGQHYLHPKPEELRRLRRCISKFVAQAIREAEQTRERETYEKAAQAIEHFQGEYKGYSLTVRECARVIRALADSLVGVAISS